MILHIFTANRYHLVPSISKGFITRYNNFEHKFILFGDKNLNKELYINLYKTLNFSNYFFCTSLREFFAIIHKHKKHPILFHAGSYSWFLTSHFAGCENVNWVNWGAGASIGKSLKSKLFTPIKKYLYKKFNSIIVLMQGDKDTLIRDFRICENKVSVMSYSSKDPNKYSEIYSVLLDKNENKIVDSNYKPLVLLGNNPSNMDEYISLIKGLKTFVGKIRVQCMLNYSLEKNEKYYELIELGYSIYGEDFRANEEFHEGFENYINYMNTCDIYICNSEKQTGLGAIYTTLSLGKKVYITGKNLSWIQSLNALVFDAKDIFEDLQFEMFIKPLTYNERIENLNSIQKMREKGQNNWDGFLEKISIKSK